MKSLVLILMNVLNSVVNEGLVNNFNAGLQKESKAPFAFETAANFETAAKGSCDLFSAAFSRHSSSKKLRVPKKGGALFEKIKKEVWKFLKTVKKKLLRAFLKAVFEFFGIDFIKLAICANPLAFLLI